jgi:3-hydroxyacyl-CoA dehydrogenase
MPLPTLSKYGSRRKTRVKSGEGFYDYSESKKAEIISNNLSSLKNPRAARTKKWYLLLLCFLNRNPLWQK